MMSAPIHFKPVPQSIVVYGAGGRMGTAVADYLRYAAPDIRLRLVTHSPQKLIAVQQAFPGAEVVQADYLDLPSLQMSVNDMEGLFVVTPSGLDEATAMNNLVRAVEDAGVARHLVRVVGYEPEATMARVPPELAGRTGDAIGHFIAKPLLDKSGLPVTFLNCGASLMDNFLFAAPRIKQDSTLLWPYRHVPLVDVRDFGEIAARLLLSNDARHITQFHTVNNGYDNITTPQVAMIMSDVLRRPIEYDGDKRRWMEAFGPILDSVKPGEAEYRWAFIQFEESNSVAWALNDFAERTLGRRPTTFRSWLMEHRHVFA